MRNKLTISALALLALSVSAMPTFAQAVRTGFDSVNFPGNDDGSVGPVSIGFAQPINFFGGMYSQLYVNNNGNVTFDNPLSTFTPFDLFTANRVIIAPFFGDVDTRNSNDTMYGSGMVGGNAAFGVSWRDVGYFSRANDKLNTFQLVMIDRTDTGAGNFDFELNYDKIQWETGGFSGGSGGLGGSSARAGYSNGDPMFSFELPGSAVNGALLDTNMVSGLIYNSLNSNVSGRYLFNVRNGAVAPNVPEPGTIALLVVGAGSGLLLRRKRSARA